MTKTLFLLLLFPTFTWCQNVTTSELGGQSNVYNNALKHYLILTSEGGKPIYDTLFIQKNDDLTDSLMTVIRGINVVVVDSSIFQEKLRQGSFVLHKLFPLSFNKGIFSIYIVPYSVRKPDDEVFLERAGHFKVDYKYNNKVNALEFTKGKSYGY